MIRAYQPADLDAVLEVWHEASLVAHSFLSRELLETERQEAAERWIPMADVAVYEVDGRVAGFIALVGNEVGAVFVLPELQGNGIGRHLMDHARASRPFLELEVFEANGIGRRFYDAYGFVPVGSHVHQPTGHNQIRLRLGAGPC